MALSRFAIGSVSSTTETSPMIGPSLPLADNEVKLNVVSVDVAVKRILRCSQSRLSLVQPAGIACEKSVDVVPALTLSDLSVLTSKLPAKAKLIW